MLKQRFRSRIEAGVLAVLSSLIRMEIRYPLSFALHRWKKERVLTCTVPSAYYLQTSRYLTRY